MRRSIHWEVDCDDSSISQGGLDFNRSAMGGHDFVNEAESESSSRLLVLSAGRIDPVEAFK